MERSTWFVFGRREYQEPLTQIGRLELVAGTPVADATRRQFGEQWLELVAIPENGLSWAIRED
jgi:hypothetical protein